MNFRKNLKILFAFLLVASACVLTGADSTSAINDYRAGRYEQAFKEFQAASHTGDVTAMYYAGLMYVKGEGVPKSVSKGMYCLRAAAGKGSTEAALMLAHLYQYGEGVRVNPAQADYWNATAVANSRNRTVAATPRSVSNSMPNRVLVSNSIQNIPNNTRPLAHHSLVESVIQFLRSASTNPRARVILMVISVIFFIFAFILFMVLRSGTDEPLPEPVSLSVRGFRSGDAIAFGWRLMKRNAGFSVALFFVYMALNYSLNLVKPFIPHQISALILFWIVFIIWSLILNFLRIRIVLNTFDQGIAHGKWEKGSASRFGDFIFVEFLYGLILVMVFIFSLIVTLVIIRLAIHNGSLMIPSVILAIVLPLALILYFMCKYYFAPWIALDEPLGALAAMDRSAQLTAGVKSRIFFLQMGVAGLNLLGFLTLGLGLPFFVPTGWYAEAYFYRSLNRRKEPVTTRTKAPLLGRSPVFMGTVSIFGWILLGTLSGYFQPTVPSSALNQDSFAAKIAQLVTSRKRAQLQTQMNAAYAIQWQRFKPIYDAAGMTNVWTLMEAGKCDEAEKLLQNPASYQPMDQKMGAASRTQMIAMSLKLCRDRFGDSAASK